MTYSTHKQFGVFWAIIGAIILNTKGLTRIDYYISIIIIIQFAKIGAEFPDWDHGLDYVKNKTVFSWIINRIIWVTGGRHRSWQTHSIDIAVLFTFLSFYFPKKAYEMGYISNVNMEVLTIILVGFSLGWLSHLFSDMLTSGKVKLISLIDFKIGLVPKQLFCLRFNTGNEWEEFVYTVTRILNILTGAVAIVYPYIGDMLTDKLIWLIWKYKLN